MTMPETKPWADTREMLPRTERAAARLMVLMEDMFLCFGYFSPGIELLVDWNEEFKNDQLQSM